jgi:thiamine-phosphate pyrophosphorylase
VVHGLYAILDLGRIGPRDPGAAAAALARGGASVVQLRAKSIPAGRFLSVARAVRHATREAGARFIVNDRVDVALCAEADGVHLGQRDLPVAAARRIAPAGFLIGISTHNLGEVAAALTSGADYLGFGPVFATTSKDDPDPVQGTAGLAEAVRACGLPVVAIGGITLDRVPLVRRTGAAAVAVISDLLSAEDLAGRARAFVDAWG